ncbi:DUF2332 family protein [Microbacterium halophytorum]|uniref:DUF2332 family protein n=1 Tax=Microbacterium halophytorum TaxID=2067568 RepID=UPI001E63A079|nr:DUF2332 family protein [Microbacterium halophytorum]
MTDSGEAKGAAALAAVEVRERYARFAREEAPGRSDLYAEWAAGVAADPGVLRALAGLGAPHRQPPLVFAVSRMLGAPEGPYAGWAGFFRAHEGRIVAECAARSVQTNEPLRCAPLVYALERIPGPIALLEVGASAGLCLFPERYAYRFRAEPVGDGAEPPALLAAGSVDTAARRRTAAESRSSAMGRGVEQPAFSSGSVRLEPELRGGLPAPERLPDIVWRAGIDLEPRDARDSADRAWISGLVWPGEAERAARIAAALDVAAADPPRIVRGDASEPGVLAALAAEAPAGTTLVVTTPGVLPHVPRTARERLIAIIRGLDARWVTLDSPRAHDAWTQPVGADADGFVLALDGEPIARADPLGGWIAPA